jgi:hypothetical protein
MPDRDWEKELAEIDRRLASAPAEAEAPPVATPPSKGRPVAPAALTTRPSTAAPTAAPVARRHWKATAGLFVRLLVTAALLACVVVWPYETRCGPWLAGYLTTIGLTALAALWTSVAAWRHRGAIVHVLSLAVLVTAGVYAGLEVLPRIGYAMPNPAHPAMWACK